DAFLEAGHRHRHLEGGAGRVPALDRAILQRAQRVVQQRLPGVAADAGGKRVGVVRRQAGHGEYFAGGRLERYRRAPEAIVPERRLRGALDVGVDGQLHALALARVVLANRVYLPPEAVVDDVTRAVLAHQITVVRLLDAGLPDDGTARDAVELLAIQLRLGDFPDVADEMCG